MIHTFQLENNVSKIKLLFEQLNAVVLSSATAKYFGLNILLRLFKSLALYQLAECFGVCEYIFVCFIMSVKVATYSQPRKVLPSR